MRKKIIVSHGNKGGCGKSVVSNTVCSFFETHEIPFLLVEADANEKGGQPDVGPLFIESEYGSVISAPLQGDKTPVDMIADIFDIIEGSSAQYVVINTPAGASAALDEVGDLISDVAEGMGYDIIILYSLFNSPMAIVQAKKVLEERLARDARHFLFIKNEFFGIPDLSLEPTLCSVPSVTLKVLHQNLMSKIQQNQSLAVALNELPLVQKIQLKQWFNDLIEQGFFTLITEEGA